MTIPDYQTIMLPLLKLASDGKERHFRDAVEQLASEFSLSDDERRELLPSGGAPLFNNRVGWARTYLKQAGLLGARKRGYFHITEQGKALLNSGPENINVGLLDKYESFRSFRTRTKREKDIQISQTIRYDDDADMTPEDALAAAYGKLRKSLEEDLLDQLSGMSPSFFERLVIDLLVAMGYGGSREDAGKAIGKSGDGGIDGVIKEDKLGLDAIYVQAKRWDKESTVGRPEIQRFAGALAGIGSSKGVFITTARYSREAIDYASRITSSKIILVDGDQLAGLMVDHNVGVFSVGTYEVKKIDQDYFSGE
jgi:Restriction endonuclease